MFYEYDWWLMVFFWDDGINGVICCFFFYVIWVIVFWYVLFVVLFWEKWCGVMLKCGEEVMLFVVLVKESFLCIGFCLFVVVIVCVVLVLNGCLLIGWVLRLILLGWWWMLRCFWSGSNWSGWCWLLLWSVVIGRCCCVGMLWWWKVSVWFVWIFWMIMFICRWNCCICWSVRWGFFFGGIEWCGLWVEKKKLDEVWFEGRVDWECCWFVRELGVFGCWCVVVV